MSNIISSNKLIVEKTNDFKRLDIFLLENLDEMTRSQIAKVIKNGQVFVNDVAITKPGFSLRSGNAVVFNIVEANNDYLKSTKIPLDVVYEDHDLLVINKQKGLVVHPANGHVDDTLVNALRYHLGDKYFDGDNDIRPGIVHRIDKDTSGLLVVAKNNKTLIALQELLKKHKINREYYAIVWGNIPEKELHVNAPIGRDKVIRQKMAVAGLAMKPAITHGKIIERINNEFTLLQLELETGRTHQIRVHLSHIKYPIVGDPVYGRRTDQYADKGQFLHAFRLSFVHPITKESMTFETKMPDYFEEFLKENR